MSAADRDNGGRLIQIGVALLTTSPYPETFSSLINPGEFTWDARAAAVHGYTEEEILNAPTAQEVDNQLYSWMINHGATPKHKVAIAVGFNVGAFDLPHVALVLPKTMTLLSRRTADLNAICFALEGKEHNGSTPTWSGWKRIASIYAERTIATLPQEPGSAAHDAGYDALLHLYAFHYLKAAINNTTLTIPQTLINKNVKKLTGTLLAKYGLTEACERTGYTPEQLKGWSQGGRITDPTIETTLTQALQDE